MLVDTVDGGAVEGRAAHQAPEVDGSTTLVAADGVDLAALRPGDLVRARVTGTEGVDLVAVPVEMVSAAVPAVTGEPPAPEPPRVRSGAAATTPPTC